MKTLHLPVFLPLIVLASCTSTPKPTEVVIPADLAFSAPFVQVLSQSGITIVSVQSSAYTAMFPSTDKAVWMKTDEGIVEAIFFDDPAEVKQLHITEQRNRTAGRYLYTIRAPSPTLLHDQIIDAAYPLYFTVKQDMLLITSSEELDKTLKHIFTGQ